MGTNSVAEALPAKVIAPEVETRFTHEPKTIAPFVLASASDQSVSEPFTVVKMFLIEVLVPCPTVTS